MTRRTEFMLAVLAGQGATDAEAMTFAALIDRHVIGSGLQETEEAHMRERYGLDSVEEFLAAIADVHDLAAADGRYPHRVSWLAHPTGSTPDEQFDIGLDCLLDGIASRLPSR